MMRTIQLMSRIVTDAQIAEHETGIVRGGEPQGSPGMWHAPATSGGVFRLLAAISRLPEGHSK